MWLHTLSCPQPLVSQQEPHRQKDRQSDRRRAGSGPISSQPDYATAIHFPAAVCHMIDLSI